MKLSQLTTSDTNIIDPRNYNPATGNALPQTILSNVLKTLPWILGVLAVMSIIYGGYLYITAGANAEKAEQGKRVIIYSVIAIVVVVLSYMIYNFIIAEVK